MGKKIGLIQYTKWGIFVLVMSIIAYVITGIIVIPLIVGAAAIGKGMWLVYLVVLLLGFPVTGWVYYNFYKGRWAVRSR